MFWLVWPSCRAACLGAHHRFLSTTITYLESTIPKSSVTGVNWDRHLQSWICTYLTTTDPPTRLRQIFPARRHGLSGAKQLAETARLTAERDGLARIVDSARSVKTVKPAKHQSDVVGVRWSKYGWRVVWFTVNERNVRTRNDRLFRVNDERDVDKIRLMAEQFRNEIDRYLNRPGLRGRADYQSGVKHVIWAGYGGMETKGGQWAAYLVYRDADGRKIRCVKRGFAVVKYGFDKALQLAIEAVRAHAAQQEQELALQSSTQPNQTQPN